MQFTKSIRSIQTCSDFQPLFCTHIDLKKALWSFLLSESRAGLPFCFSAAGGRGQM